MSWQGAPTTITFFNLVDTSITPCSSTGMLAWRIRQQGNYFLHSLATDVVDERFVTKYKGQFSLGNQDIIYAQVPWTIFFFNEKVLQMHISIINVPNNCSPSRFSTAANQLQTKWFPACMNIDSNPSYSMVSSFLFISLVFQWSAGSNASFVAIRLNFWGSGRCQGRWDLQVVQLLGIWALIILFVLEIWISRRMMIRHNMEISL